MRVTSVTVAVKPDPSPEDSGSPRRAVQPARAARSARTDELVELLISCSDQDEDERLRQDLISVNMPVARSIAGRYRSRGIASEDLDQIAYLALTKAARRFDPRAGHAFLSFCVPTVHGEVRRHFR